MRRITPKGAAGEREYLLRVHRRHEAGTIEHPPSATQAKDAAYDRPDRPHVIVWQLGADGEWHRREFVTLGMAAAGWQQVRADLAKPENAGGWGRWTNGEVLVASEGEGPGMSAMADTEQP